jgi:hypothetical protein
VAGLAELVVVLRAALVGLDDHAAGGGGADQLAHLTVGRGQDRSRPRAANLVDWDVDDQRAVGTGIERARVCGASPAGGEGDAGDVTILERDIANWIQLTEWVADVTVRRTRTVARVTMGWGVFQDPGGSKQDA